MRSCKEDIRTIENGEKNLFLRRTFNSLFAGGKKRKRKTSTSDSNVEIARKFLKKHNNIVQSVLNDEEFDLPSLSIREKLRLLIEEAAKIAKEAKQKPKKRKKEKEVCPVCSVEINTLSLTEYTMCPRCNRPTCNACLCKRYKTTGYDNEGYFQINMNENRSGCPWCNQQIPNLDMVCLPRYQWEAKTKRETAYFYEYDEATGKDIPNYDEPFWRYNLDGKKRLTENLFLEEGDMVQWYPKGSQTTFRATIEVKKRVTNRAVYTKRGRCLPGYVRTGEKIKSGRHKGDYRCKMSNESKKSGFVRVKKSKKYKIKDMLFFVNLSFCE